LDHHNLPVVAGDCLLSCQSHFAVRRSCTQTEIPPLTGTREKFVFSIIVKLKTFTKQLSSQWVVGFFSQSANYCCTAMVSVGLAARIGKCEGSLICLVKWSFSCSARSETDMDRRLSDFRSAPMGNPS
jgi:hypothetical protein